MINKKNFMLCESIKEEDLKNLKGEWIANIKYDGERIIIVKKGEEVFLINRAERIKNQIYPEIVRKIKQIDIDSFILDSEVITTDNLFNSLQHRSHLGSKEKVEQAEQKYPITEKVFDIISLNGEDLRNKPLKERIEILNENFKNKVDLVEYNDIHKLLSFAKSKNLEGVVVKNYSSKYESRRSPNWLKLKLFKQAVIRVIRYTTNNSGIRAEDLNLNAVQIAGHNVSPVKESIDKKGYCDIIIQFLEKTKQDRFRFISYKGVLN